MGSRLAGMRPLSGLARLVSGFAKQGVGSFSLFRSDDAVAVGINPLEVLPGPEELAARDNAVAVAIHLAKPQGSSCRRRRSALGARIGSGRSVAADEEIPRLPLS